MSFCVVNGTNPNIVNPVNDFKDLTAQQILAKLNIEDSCLSYRNPFYIYVFKPEECPLKLFPKLEFTDTVSDYPPPPYCLEALPISDENEYWLRVSVKTQLPEPIPFMNVPLAMNELHNLTAEDIILSCRSTFGYEFTDEKLSIDEEEIPIDTPAADVIERCKEKRLTLTITVGQQGTRKIIGRKHVTAEIISSEESYNKDLEMLETFWEPEFRKCKALEEREVHSLFRDIKKIREVHVAFLEDLKKIKPGFECEMSYTFMRHLSKFTKATTFVSAFRSLDDMMKEKRSSRSIDRQLTEIENRNPLQNGRNFASYYVTPVQRYPRYPLLFRELDKCTPSFHPEKKYIQLTFDKLTEVNRSIDAISHRVTQIKLMNDIQGVMPPDRLIIDHGREIIDQENIRIVSKKSGTGVLYLFNDLIMLCYSKKKLHKPVFEIAPMNFCFANGKPSVNSLFLEADKDNQFQIDFQDAMEKSTWMDLYRALMAANFKKIKTTSPYIKWMDCDPPGVGERVGHDGCLATGKAYIIGGENESRQISSLMIKYNVADSTWESENTPVPARIGHTVVSFRGDIYVCFGTNQVGDGTMYNDIWIYKTAEKKWEQVEFANNKHPIGRYGHSCVIYEGKFYFFGGKIKTSKNKEELCNLITCFDPHTNEISEITPDNDGPKPRSQHAAVAVDKEMVIIGGRGENFLGDVWVYNFTTNLWGQRKKANVSERMDHKAVLLANRFIFVVGGLKDQNLQETCVIDTKSWTTINFEQFGNIPPHLSRHSMISLENNKVLIFGGINRTTRKSYSSAWTFDVSDQIGRFVSAAPNEVVEYWIEDDKYLKKRHRASALLVKKSGPYEVPEGLEGIITTRPVSSSQLIRPENAPKKEDFMDDSNKEKENSEAKEKAKHKKEEEKEKEKENSEAKEKAKCKKEEEKEKEKAKESSEAKDKAKPKKEEEDKEKRNKKEEGDKEKSKDKSKDKEKGKSKDKERSKSKEKRQERHKHKHEEKAKVQKDAEPKTENPRLLHNEIIAGGFRLKRIASTVSNNIKDDRVFNRDTWKASGSKFNRDKMCSELGIELGLFSIFQIKSTERKMLYLWQKNKENQIKEEEINKMERFITGDFTPPKGTTFLLKIFEDASRCSRLTRVDSSITIEEITKKVEGIIKNNSPILSIAISNSEQKSLDEESLRTAMCCVYKGDMRCLTINAL